MNVLMKQIYLIYYKIYNVFSFENSKNQNSFKCIIPRIKFASNYNTCHYFSNDDNEGCISKTLQ